MVGVGSLGQHHARIYSSLPGAELAGIFDTSKARAEEIAAKVGCRRFASLDELAGACDAVSIVVPTDRHAEVALPLLEQYVALFLRAPFRLVLLGSLFEETFSKFSRKTSTLQQAPQL